MSTHSAHFSAFLYEVPAAFRAVDTYPSAASWDTHLLAAAGAAENVIFAPFLELEAPFFPLFCHIKLIPQVNLIFLIPFSDISGKETEIKDNDSRPD